MVLTEFKITIPTNFQKKKSKMNEKEFEMMMYYFLFLRKKPKINCAKKRDSRNLTKLKVNLRKFNFNKEINI